MKKCFKLPLPRKSNHQAKCSFILSDFYKRHYLTTINKRIIDNHRVDDTDIIIERPFAIPFASLKHSHPSTLLSFKNNVKHRKGINILTNNEIFLELTKDAGSILNNNNKDKFPLIYPIMNDKKHGRVIVILFGWLGSNWRHVDKYINWYDYCHVETLSTIPPIISTISMKSTTASINEFLKQLKNILPKEEENVKIIFHVLSGNGVHLLSRLFQNEEYLKDYHNKVKGIIVDSAPPRFIPQRFTEGFVGAIKTSLFKDHRVDSDPSLLYHHWLLTPLISTFFKSYFHLKGAIKMYEDLEKNLVEQTIHLPKLFIYSHGDTLVPHGDVDYFLSKHFDRHERMIITQEIDDEFSDKWFKSGNILECILKRF
ncbi:hypothetical protein ABK040_007145 [Willaertia magna]